MLFTKDLLRRFVKQAIMNESQEFQNKEVKNRYAILGGTDTMLGEYNV